jgi:hypothetical protein
MQKSSGAKEVKFPPEHPTENTLSELLKNCSIHAEGSNPDYSYSIDDILEPLNLTEEATKILEELFILYKEEQKNASSFANSDVKGLTWDKIEEKKKEFNNLYQTDKEKISIDEKDPTEIFNTIKEKVRENSAAFIFSQQMNLNTANVSTILKNHWKTEKNLY